MVVLMWVFLVCAGLVVGCLSLLCDLLVLLLERMKNICNTGRTERDPINVLKGIRADLKLFAKSKTQMWTFASPPV